MKPPPVSSTPPTPLPITPAAVSEAAGASPNPFIAIADAAKGPPPAAEMLGKMPRAKEFAKAMGVRALWTLFMQVGTPVVAVTAPFLIERIDGNARNNLTANLVVGSALGGAWGALVGATIPVNHAGVRIPRIKAMGLGAGAGLVLAPAVAGMSRLVVTWFVKPGEEAAAAATADAKAGQAATTPA